MIISMRPHATREEIDHVCERIAEFGYKVHSIEGEERVVIGAVGEEGDSRGAQYVRDHYQPDMLIIGIPCSLHARMNRSGAIPCRSQSVTTDSAHKRDSAHRAARDVISRRSIARSRLSRDAGN